MICPAIRFPSQPRISRPVDVQHTTHVSYNPITRQYRGLPIEWKAELNRQFGHDPTTVESEKLPEYDAGIPTVLIKMKNFLLENNGLQTEGIFRTAPGPSVCDQTKEVLDSGKIIGMDVDVVVVANLIKIYFRELPTPIIPFDLREEISRCQNIADCNAIVDCLAEPCKSLLLWLLDLAALFAFFECENKMTPRNFSIILAPNLFTVPPEFSSVSALYLSQKVAACLEKLIEERIRQMRNPLAF